MGREDEDGLKQEQQNGGGGEEHDGDGEPMEERPAS